VFGTGFPEKFIPSFTWGGIQQSDAYSLDKAFETATKVMERRSVRFTEVHKKILSHVFEMTASHRIPKK
jgi:hypothetical protein